MKNTKQAKSDEETENKREMTELTLPQQNIFQFSSSMMIDDDNTIIVMMKSILCCK